MNKWLKNLIDNKYFPLLYWVMAFTYCLIRNWSVWSGEKALIGGDANAGYYAISFLKNNYLNGEIPFWNKFLAGGSPYLGVTYSFFNFYNILSLLLQAEVAYFIVYIFSISLGSVFLYLYLIKINCRRDVSLVFAIIYLLSIHLGGLRTSHMSIIVTITCLPVLLYLIEKYCEEKKPYILLSLSLIMALQFHNGFMQICLYSDMVIALYFLIRFIQSGGKWNLGLLKCIQWIIIYACLIIGFIIPIISLLAQYSEKSSTDSSFLYFISGSIHPIKLIMMFIPNIWDDVYTPLAEYNIGTSGMDIEIFLGTLVAIISVSGIVAYFKKSRLIRLSFFFVFISFAFASCYAFTPLAKIFFEIPIVNMFRMPSRALFIFILFIYVIAAITLSNIVSEKRYDLLYKSSGLYILCWGIMCIVENVVGLQYFENVYDQGRSIAIWICIFNFFVLLLSKYNAFGKYEKLLNKFVCVFILIFTIFQTREYNQVNGISTKTFLLPIEEIVLENIGNNKILQLSTDDVSYVKSIVHYNRALYTGIPTINAESPYNNPILNNLLSLSSDDVLLNQTNAMAYFKNSYDNLSFQNDLLSMLGIKYLLDSEDIMNNLEVFNRNDSRTILHVNEVKVEAEEPTVVFAEPIELLNDYDYIVSFKYICNDWDDSVYLDFYGKNYDYKEQDIKLNLSSGEGKYSIVLNSGNIPEDIISYFRIISNGSTDITFNDIEIKTHIMEKNDIYQQFASGKGFDNKEVEIYENTNVRDILYVPEQVIFTNDISIIYDYQKRESLDKTSYVEDLEGFIPANTEITNIRWENNQVTAEVKAEGTSFINFSQCITKDWKVYIDDVETQNVTVNGLIQGVVVPEGTHKVCFKYFPEITVLSNITNLFIFMVIIGIAVHSYVSESRRKA